MQWDIAITIIVLGLAIFALGISFHRFIKGRTGSFENEFFIGGRDLGPLVLAFTMIASYASAGTFIGTTGVAYDVGFSWVFLSMTQVAMGVYVLGILGKKFAIMARKINAITVTDFLFARYKSHSIVIGSAVGILIFLIASMIAQFAGGTRILETITGLPYSYGLLIFGLGVVIYTTFGGFRGVAITDAILGIMMVIGGVILWIVFLLKTDGLPSLVNQLSVEHPEMLEIPGPSGISPAYLFSYFILLGLAPISLPYITVRAMTYKDSHSMHRGIMYSAILMGIFTLGFASLGPIARVLYPDIPVSDMALPTLIVDLMPGWLAGFILFAPIAAIMSTVNSMLLVASSSIVKDIYMKYVNKNAEDKKVSRISYAMTMLIGLVVIILALSPPDYVQFLTFYATGGLASTFFVPIVMGLYWKGATKWGGITSMFGGLISYLIFETWFPEPFGMHSIVTSLAVSFVLMFVVSLFTPKLSEETLYKLWGERKSEENDPSIKNIGNL